MNSIGLLVIVLTAITLVSLPSLWKKHREYRKQRRKIEVWKDEAVTLADFYPKAMGRHITQGIYLILTNKEWWVLVERMMNISKSSEHMKWIWDQHIPMADHHRSLFLCRWRMWYDKDQLEKPPESSP